MQIRSDFFDVQILAGFQARQRGNRGHPRSEVETREFRFIETDGARGDQFVGWPGYI